MTDIASGHSDWAKATSTDMHSDIIGVCGDRPQQHPPGHSLGQKIWHIIDRAAAPVVVLCLPGARVPECCSADVSSRQKASSIR
jgi:hypothetical protein